MQIVVAILLVVFILLQHGRGADAGAAFGSGASSTMFGSRGSSNFLTKVTAFLVAIFLGNSLFLAYLASQNVRQSPASLMDVPTVVEETPVLDETEMEMEEGTVAPDTLPSDLPAIPE